MLLPMVNQLREQNRKIRTNWKDMERKAEMWTAGHLVKLQELRRDFKEVQRRLIKTEAKRDRYKQKLEAMNKFAQPATKQRTEADYNFGEGCCVTITPGNIETCEKESKIKEPVSSRVLPLKGLNS